MRVVGCLMFIGFMKMGIPVAFVAVVAGTVGLTYAFWFSAVMFG